MQGTFYAAAFLERTGIAIKQTAIIIAVDGDDPQIFVENVSDYLAPLKEARINYKKIYGF